MIILTVRLHQLFFLPAAYNIETPSNPLLNIFPLREIAFFAKEHGLITIVDNTFASPVNQLPLAHGIDISVHSGTKYLGGHNDLPFGALISNNINHKEFIFSTAKIYGGSLSPFQCYLAERSLKTLSLRVRKQKRKCIKACRIPGREFGCQKSLLPRASVTS